MPMVATVLIRTRRAPSPEIRARDTSLDGAANGSAGINSAPNVDAESLPSTRPLLAQYPFNSHHDWHLEILFIVAITFHLAYIVLQSLKINNPVVAFGVIVTT